jgi:hypothetical protein
MAKNSVYNRLTAWMDSSGGVGGRGAELNTMNCYSGVHNTPLSIFLMRLTVESEDVQVLRGNQY